MRYQIDPGRGPVIVFCPNLALDHIIEADGLSIGRVQNISNGILSPGGKGLNVARAARCMGIQATVVGLVAGRTGALLSSLLGEEDIHVLSPRLTYETRIATIVHDRIAHTTTVLNERGPTVSRQDWTILTNLVKSRFENSSTLICNDTPPPGISEDSYVDLIEGGRQAGVPVIVDVSAETLRQCASAQPEIIKVNLEEAESALEPPAIKNPMETRACEAARRLQLISGGAVIVTISGGAAIAGKRSTAFLRAPKVAVCNEIGAGDSFLAGIIDGLSKHGDLLAAARRAVAVASASVETAQPGRLDAERANELEHMIVIDRR